VAVSLGAQAPVPSGVVPPVPDEPDHRLESDGPRVRVYRVRLDPGDSIPVHTHAAGWVSITVVGGLGPGTARWHEAGSPNPLAAGMYPMEIVEVEPK
jgi:quercetin dioxygenase-like cupin family protein